MMIRLIFAIFVTIILIACGPKISGTGQHGEAAIAGVVLDENGLVIVDQTVKIARNDYRTPTGALTFSSFTIDSIITDNNGFFRIEVPLNGIYTISAKTDSSLLLLSNNIVKDSDINLGDIKLENEVPITIYPWWDGSISNGVLEVEGTDWKYSVASDIATVIMLPKGDVVLVQNWNSEKKTLNTSEVSSVGDSSKYTTPMDTIDTFSLSSITLPAVAAVNEVVILSVDTTTIKNSIIVNWGDDINDSTAYNDTIIYQKNTMTHKYLTSGIFTVGIKEIYMASDSIWNTLKASKYNITIK